MQAFDYVGATSLEEVIGLLQQHAGEATLMAGGTALMLLLKEGLVQPAYVVGLRAVAPLHGIRRTPDGGLEIRALVTHRQAECSPEVQSYCPALAVAFSKVATIRIRNQATVGGNLAHADPAQDPPPMLLALDAEIVVAGPKGERSVPVDAFFRDYFQTALAADEVLTAVRLPALAANTRAIYLKFLPRTADDYATVAVAVTVRLGPGNVCEDLRLGLGSVANVPMRVPAVENALRGQRLTPPLVREAAALVHDAVAPVDDARGSARYKRGMARVWTERALLRLLDGTGPSRTAP
jgi:carbon-monoxide dehydrogenase medium subunit